MVLVLLHVPPNHTRPYMKLYYDYTMKLLLQRPIPIVKLLKVDQFVKCALHFLWFNRQILRRVACISLFQVQMDITAN